MIGQSHFCRSFTGRPAAAAAAPGDLYLPTCPPMSLPTLPTRLDTGATAEWKPFIKCNTTTTGSSEVAILMYFF